MGIESQLYGKEEHPYAIYYSKNIKGFPGEVKGEEKLCAALQ